MIVLDNKNQRIKQRSYRWWCGRKKRVKKKYTLFLSGYLSPKNMRLLIKTYNLSR